MGKLNRYEVTQKPDAEDEETGEVKRYGWRKIATVKKPAVIVKGMAFSKEEVDLKMAFADDVKMRIAAPVSMAMVIPRKGIKPEEGEKVFNEGEPFEAEFTEAGIEEMFVSFMSDPKNLIDAFCYEHTAEVVPCFLLEIWLVDDPLRDRSFSTFGVEVEKGTVFAVCQYTDREYYEKVVNEGCTGFSVEGNFGLELKFSQELVDYSDVLVMDGDKVLMLKRTDNDEFEPSKWGLAGGKIDEGESAQEAGARELMEETGLTYSEIKPVDVIENEDGTTTNYFIVDFQDYEGEVKISEEHVEYKFFSIDELEELPVIMGQNERFTHLLKSVINNKSESNMKEGEEFKIGDQTFIVKDGKPVLKEAEAAVEASTEEEKPEEAEVEAAAEGAPTGAAPMTKEDIVTLINETVKPLIEESMKAVVDAVVTEDKQETDEDKAAAEAKMAYSVEGKGGSGSYLDFLNLPAANRG